MYFSKFKLIIEYFANYPLLFYIKIADLYFMEDLLTRQKQRKLNESDIVLLSIFYVLVYISISKHKILENIYLC